MNSFKNILIFISCITLVFSCQEDDASAENTLADLTAKHSFKIDNVIACASSSDVDKNTVYAYFYPRPGATDFRYYETTSIEEDKNNYTNYQKITLTPSDLFNGYLKKFSRTILQEKWVIITFFENDSLHLSNPIRLKHKSKPTQFTDKLETNYTIPRMPTFNWEDGIYNDNKIYFQIISDVENDLLSGTYTFDRRFQYYNLENVVLNITREVPPALNVNEKYYFTLMGVSEDNWVNLIIQNSVTPNL